MTSPAEPHTRIYSHINGPTSELLDRLAVAELCKGWAVYRDASEWQNFRSMFAEEAYVWTTWSGPKPIDEFISVSKEGKDSGAFIMHRECGTLVELEPNAGRAIGKMKATITQRFSTPESVYDIDCDCRFIFFCEKRGEGEGWRMRYAKLIYEKDKIVPVSGVPPVFANAELEGLPDGYRFLGAAQRRLGYEIDKGLVAIHDAEGVGRMYAAVERWLAGGDVELFW